MLTIAACVRACHDARRRRAALYDDAADMKSAALGRRFAGSGRRFRAMAPGMPPHKAMTAEHALLAGRVIRI